jgi:hypothetical protein
VPIYAPGVTLGISRKRKEGLGRIVDNRPVKSTWLLEPRERACPSTAARTEGKFY